MHPEGQVKTSVKTSVHLDTVHFSGSGLPYSATPLCLRVTPAPTIPFNETVNRNRLTCANSLPPQEQNYVQDHSQNSDKLPGERMNSPGRTRQINYVRLFGVTTFVVVLYFILEINFQYHVSAYNTWIIPFAVMIPLGVWLDNKLQTTFLPALLCYIGSVFSMIAMIYVCGGFRAPGIFWLVLMPLAGGILMGQRGIWTGTAILIATVIFFYLSDKFDFSPNIFASLSPADYDQEKKIDVTVFLVFTFLLTHYFFKTEMAAQEKLKEQYLRIDNLLKVLLHDVATPLTAIEYRACQIEKLTEDQLLKKFATKIALQSANVAHILSSIREFRALVDGKKTIQKRQLTIRKLITDAIEACSTKAEIKGVEIVFSETTPFDIKIKTDEILFKTVILGNVLSNAIKFSPSGQKIFLRLAQPAPDRVEIIVEDHGIGIPKEILATIFEAHKPTSRLGTSGESGTGYGLPLVKRYLESLGGEVSISSIEKTASDCFSGTKVRIQHPIEEH